MSDSVLNDLAHMRDAVFFEGPNLRRKLSRFWILLVLASIIASAGVVADSTATVIGAMIVAPLMTPILGTTLAVILADRANLLRSVALVASGAAAAIAIGYLMGMFLVGDVVAATNSQVAGRVSPTVVDLVAALATGVVGSVALARSDISDTLPGVAIAISLVPPLAVVGLTAEAGEWSESLGALLLFATNVAAILATGLIVMAMFRVHRRVPAGGEHAVNRKGAIAVIVAFFVVVGVPLFASSVQITRGAQRESTVRRVTQDWAEPLGWSVLSVTANGSRTDVVVVGLPPLPDTAQLAVALTEAGVDPTGVVLELLPRATVSLGDEG
jgi:uncharacterized hydrophobic protein (TIGR00271 family)